MKASKPRKKPSVRKAPVARKPRAPVASATTARELPRLLGLLVGALDAKKAEDLRVLRVQELSSITDYLVLATANSEPHQRALRIEAERILDAEKARILGVDTSKGSGWTVVDAIDVMVHLFTAENRAKYRLDLLWRDAREIPLKDLGVR